MNTKVRLFIAVLVLIVIVVAGWFLFDGGWGRKEIRNVIIISMDTCNGKCSISNAKNIRCNMKKCIIMSTADRN